MEVLLELTKDIFKKRKSVRFQAKGWSMRPFIQDGDFITVSPVESSSVKTGEVVFYLADENKVIVHRVMGKQKKEGGMTLLIKGDAAFGPPERVDIQKALGKVVAIERKGRIRRIDTKLYHIIGLFFVGIAPFNRWIYPAGSVVKSKGRKLLGGLTEKIQSLKIYSTLVKRLRKEKIRFQIAVPEDAQALSRLYRYNQEPELKDITDGSFKKGGKSGVTEFWLVAKRKDKVIAGVNLTKFPESNFPYAGWWIFVMKVNWRYRRMGIAEKLTKMATELAAQHGASEIKLLVFEDAKPAQGLYQKSGFRQISIPELEKHLIQEARTTLRRQKILAKNIKSG
ncbi:MAG: signal peptidase I [Candidatus Aminicenantes bacterium]|nr:signal peptidase I [Candidatus Aminicenantes bacterium]